jgi:hypothetical protein
MTAREGMEMEHKYKVGDEVLIRVKVMELLNTKANGYMMTSGDFDHWVIQEQNIHGLAPATAPAIPEGWTAASVPVKKLPIGEGVLKVEIMLKNGETAFGWQGHDRDVWHKLEGGFREKLRDPYYTPDGDLVRDPNPVIAWRELDSALAADLAR